MRLGSILALVRLEKAAPPVPDAAGGFAEAWIPLDPPDWRYAIETAGQALERTVGATVEGAASYVLTGKPHPMMTIAARATVVHGDYEGRIFDVRALRLTPDVPPQQELLCTEVIRS